MMENPRKKMIDEPNVVSGEDIEKVIFIVILFYIIYWFESLWSFIISQPINAINA